MVKILLRLFLVHVLLIQKTRVQPLIPAGLAELLLLHLGLLKLF